MSSWSFTLFWKGGWEPRLHLHLKGQTQNNTFGSYPKSGNFNNIENDL